MEIFHVKVGQALRSVLSLLFVIVMNTVCGEVMDVLLVEICVYKQVFLNLATHFRLKCLGYIKYSCLKLRI